jgi:hypothetical protein
MAHRETNGYKGDGNLVTQATQLQTLRVETRRPIVDKGAEEVLMGSRPAILLLALVFGTGSLLAQAPPADAGEQKIINLVQAAAIQAINFRQGDIDGFTRARANFTPDGWADYLKRMQGFLDANGAPTFTSSFVPSGNITVLATANEIIHLRVPGTLVQSNNVAKTTYRAALEIQAGGNPVRIEQLKQVTCVGESSACQ